ncbi:unnamed protein product [Closterium sp. NIES-65]|nr:unnamed protein product [Closterium sp. NIES-65]
MAKMNELVIAGMNFTCVLAAVAEYQMPEKECLLNLLAKALGYGIILGSTILKLPQILVIIRSNSIEGLSVPSFEIECIGYTVSVGYCLFKKVPFTAYGELFFLLLQSLILMFLIYSHLPNQAATTWIKVGIAVLTPLPAPTSLPLSPLSPAFKQLLRHATSALLFSGARSAQHTPTPPLFPLSSLPLTPSPHPALFSPPATPPWYQCSSQGR